MPSKIRWLSKEVNGLLFKTCKVMFCLTLLASATILSALYVLIAALQLNDFLDNIRNALN